MIHRHLVQGAVEQMAVECNTLMYIPHEANAILVLVHFRTFLRINNLLQCFILPIVYSNGNEIH